MADQPHPFRLAAPYRLAAPPGRNWTRPR